MANTTLRSGINVARYSKYAESLASGISGLSKA